MTWSDFVSTQDLSWNNWITSWNDVVILDSQALSWMTNSGIVTEPISGGNSSMELVQITMQASVQNKLSPGDIQIIEIFPSSGNCLDEFVGIQSHIEYHGYISLYWLGTSSASVVIWVDFQSWSELIVTDNLAWILPSNPIMLVSSVTLTNAWEQLKIIVSWEVIDDVVYSNLQWIQSLFFTELSGATRLFKTNSAWTPATNCGTIHSTAQVPIKAWVGLCDIRLSGIQYSGSGQYYINAVVTWSMVYWCDISDINSGRRIVNNQELSWACVIWFQTKLGLNSIEYHYFSGTEQVCYDQFIFAANYDVGIVKQYIWGGQCANSESTTSNQAVIYSSSDCGVRIQSSNLWFFADYWFNIISTIDNKDITNWNHKYKCSIDMGDGTVFQECNPNSFEYERAWVYPLVLEIRDNQNGHLICRARSFVNAPAKTMKTLDYYKYFYSLQSKLLELCQTVSDVIDEEWGSCTHNSFCDLLSGVLFESPYIDTWTSLSWTFPAWIDGLKTIKIYSVLPNPKWSDSSLEEFSVYNTWSWEINLIWLKILVGKKNISLEGTIEWWATKTFVGGRWLNNNGMCVYLYQDKSLLDSLCYEKVKEGDLVQPSSSLGSWSQIIYLQELENKQINSKSTELSCAEKIKQTKEKDNLKYKKLQESRKKDQEKFTLQIDKRRTKELIARNNRYLYENTNTLLTSSIKSNWPLVREDWFIASYIDYAHELESKIRSWYIYINKYKDAKGNHYLYTNNLKAHIQEQKNNSFGDVLLPWLSDYIDHLYEFTLNQETLDAVKRL